MVSRELTPSKTQTHTRTHTHTHTHTHTDTHTHTHTHAHTHRDTDRRIRVQHRPNAHRPLSLTLFLTFSGVLTHPSSLFLSLPPSLLSIYLYSLSLSLSSHMPKRPSLLGLLIINLCCLEIECEITGCGGVSGLIPNLSQG